MRKIERTSDVFIANDGKEFPSEIDCREYELNFLKRIECVRFFLVTHRPDLTEGRGWHGRIVVAVEASYSSELAVEEFCEQRFGSRVAFVMGCSPMQNWRIVKSNHKSWENPPHGVVGSTRIPGKRLYMVDESIREPIVSFPKPIVWKRGGGFNVCPKEWDFGKLHK